MSGNGRKWDRRDPRSFKKQKLIRTAEEELESKLGFDHFSEGEKRLGWLLTYYPVSQFVIINFIPIFIILDDYAFICFNLLYMINYFISIIGLFGTTNVFQTK